MNIHDPACPFYNYTIINCVCSKRYQANALTTQNMYLMEENAKLQKALKLARGLLFLYDTEEKCSGRACQTLYMISEILGEQY